MPGKVPLKGLRATVRPHLEGCSVLWFTSFDTATIVRKGVQVNRMLQEGKACKQFAKHTSARHHDATAIIFRMRTRQQLTIACCSSRSKARKFNGTCFRAWSLSHTPCMQSHMFLGFRTQTYSRILPQINAEWNHAK